MFKSHCELESFVERVSKADRLTNLVSHTNRQVTNLRLALWKAKSTEMVHPSCIQVAFKVNFTLFDLQRGRAVDDLLVHFRMRSELKGLSLRVEQLWMTAFDLGLS